MKIINDSESIARFYEMDRLSREASRRMSPAERDRIMQAHRAMAMTPQQRFEMMDMLSRSAAALHEFRRCEDV